jgi:hypothetical protein
MKPEVTVAPPEGLLAMLNLARMTTTTAEPGYIIGYNVPARNVISIYRHEQRAPQPQEQNTSNTAPGPHCEPCAYTDIGFAAFNLDVLMEKAAAPQSFHARDAIFELRRLTGLTWGDLAAMLSATRQSLHLWANGAPINGVNEKNVQGGGTVGELLRARRFEDAVALAGRGRGRPIGAIMPEAAPRAEKISVADMLGTRSDRLHTDEGAALRPRRGPRRGI